MNSILKDSRCAVIVAHPDDETLWAGGTILMNPANDWVIAATCRKYDADRSPKYYAAVKILNAIGCMGDMDDGPEQTPLDNKHVEETILSLLKSREYDLVITHSTQGEYTRHRRHEEVGAAVVGLIESGRLKTRGLWMFAYSDHNGTDLPGPIMNTDTIIPLPGDTWKKKHDIITRTYGFGEDSWEARTTPRKESFWNFRSTHGIRELIKERSRVT